MQYIDLFKDYVDSFLVKDQGDFMTVAPPIFFNGSSDSIAVRIARNEEGGYDISDCHTVQDYWDEYLGDTDKYSDRIETICQRFDLYRGDRGAFCTRTYGDNPVRVERHIGYFIQAIMLLGNIDT